MCAPIVVKDESVPSVSNVCFSANMVITTMPSLNSNKTKNHFTFFTVMVNDVCVNKTGRFGG